MEPTLIVAIVAVGLGLLLMVGCLGLVAIVLFMMMRRRRSAAVAPRPAEARQPSAPLSTGERKLPKPPIAAAPSATPPPPPSVPPPPPPLGGGLGNGGLIGFFDDDAHGNDAAKTELFQRGAAAFDFPDDDDDPLEEGEATEIFSAHGAAGDLAEFAFDQDLDPSGTPRPHGRK